MKKKLNKNASKKLGNAVAKKKQTAAIRNTFRRALYKANKIIAAGSSLYQNKLSMKEFKREYEQFGRRTNMLSSKKLEKNLKTFVQNEIRSETPRQCEAAAANLMKHLSNAVRALNRSKGGLETISDSNQKYIKILKEANALAVEPNKRDSYKTTYSLIKDRIPNKDDFMDVSNKYLRFKRLIIQAFGGDEYGEAYGS